jgi:hypothetical protein
VVLMGKSLNAQRRAEECKLGQQVLIFGIGGDAS